MEVKLALAALAGLVGHVAGIATHVQRSMTAAVLWDIETDVVASKTQVRIFAIAALWLKQLIFIVGGMRIVALYAIAHCRRVNLPLDISSFFVGMAGNAESYSGGGDELCAGDTSIHPDLVTAGAAHGNRRMNRLALRLVLVALDAGRRVLFGVKGYRMHSRPGHRTEGAS